MYLSFSMQRLLGADTAACSSIENEILLSKKLSGHPGIVDFIADQKIERSATSHGKTEYLLVSELCSG